MNIGIIGFGHLGNALVKGLLFKKIVSKDEIYILAKSDASKDAAKKEYGIHVCNDINEIIKKSDILFWILKGDVFTAISDNISPDINHKVNVSFMAGVPISLIQEKLGDVNITRAMPNIAIERADGIIGYTKTDNEFLKMIFCELGYSFVVEEKDIEKVTAFSACGLGFAAYILNAFQKAGEELGFPPEICEKIVSKTFISAIDMSDYEGTSKAVATKGGATEQGILCFEENNLNKIISDAMNKAYKKMK